MREQKDMDAFYSSFFFGSGVLDTLEATTEEEEPILTQPCRRRQGRPRIQYKLSNGVYSHLS